MTETATTQRYRDFLLVVAGAVFLGTLLELWFTEHLGSALQVVPFVLAIAGALAVLAAMRIPNRYTLFGLRAVMGVVAMGSLYGIYLHFTHNFEFEREIRPEAALGEIVIESLRGASPMLAPGILALAALLAAAATYRHPALRPSAKA